MNSRSSALLALLIIIILIVIVVIYWSYNCEPECKQECTYVKRSCVEGIYSPSSCQNSQPVCEPKCHPKPLCDDLLPDPWTCHTEKKCY